MKVISHPLQVYILFIHELETRKVTFYPINLIYELETFYASLHFHLPDFFFTKYN